MKYIVGIIAVCLMSAFAISVGTANAGKLSPKMEAAIKRVNNGNWTKADLAYIKSKPNIAKYIPDPRRSASTSGSKAGVYSRSNLATRDTFDGGDDGGTMNSGGDGSCANNLIKRWYMAWFRRKSLLGDTIYKYHHRVNFCTGGGIIRKFMNRYDYISDAQSIINLRERVLNQRGGVWQPKSWSKMQRRIEYCVPVGGCYATTYPWVLLKIAYYGKRGYDGHA